MSALERERPTLPGRPSLIRSHPDEFGEVAVPAHRISAYARRLPMADVGRWLSEWGPDLEGDWFPCPRCQRTASAQVLHGPSARPSDSGLTWRCGNCRADGTHEGLVIAVLHNLGAVERIAEHLRQDDE